MCEHKKKKIYINVEEQVGLIGQYGGDQNGDIGHVFPTSFAKALASSGE